MSTPGRAASSGKLHMYIALRVQEGRPNADADPFPCQCPVCMLCVLDASYIVSAKSCLPSK